MVKVEVVVKAEPVQTVVVQIFLEELSPVLLVDRYNLSEVYC
jgi:hypothetical protein